MRGLKWTVWVQNPVSNMVASSVDAWIKTRSVSAFFVVKRILLHKVNIFLNISLCFRFVWNSIYSKLTKIIEKGGIWKPTLFRGYILNLIGFLSYFYKNISILHQIPTWAMVFRIGKPPQPTLSTLTMLNKILYNAGKKY